MLSVISIGENVNTNIVDLGVFASSTAELVLMIAGVLTFLYLVYGGLLWTMSGGDKVKVESAREKITHALIGLTIVASSWALFSLADNFLGLGVAGKTSSSPSYNQPSTGGVCLYPTRRCCNTADDSTCFCDPAYKAVSLGTCSAGGGNSGVRCQCQ